uniref:NAC domain-containing protein n=1 Tax=Solanum lycopersicum TaxID=4081 RepID=K4B699_SOLLC
MGMMNFDEEQLLRYLLKFVTGMLVECDQIRFVDLYGKEKPSQLFETTTTDRHHVFTQLKKKKGNGKNFNRGIVGGGGSWKGIDNDLGQISAAANVIPNGNITQVSLVTEESKLRQGSVHQETPPDYDIATYYKQLDAHAVSVLETMVPYIPEPLQEDEVDSIPLFSEDFYIGYIDLWLKNWQ